MKYYGVMISGFLGGIGGAVYAQSISVNFAVTTILGPGFIALAAMIFGKWNPVGAMLSSLFFWLIAKFSRYWCSITITRKDSNGLLTDCTLYGNDYYFSCFLWSSSCTKS